MSAFGVLYDKTTPPLDNVSALLPGADREGASFGLGRHSGPWMIDATEFALHFKSAGRRTCKARLRSISTGRTAQTQTSSA